MKTRTLTVRGVPDATLRRLRRQAAVNRRSLNGELLVLLESAQSGAAGPSAEVVSVREPASPTYRARRDHDATLLELVDRDALAAVCRRHHIHWLAVFGSHARGDARSGSDVDVLVDFEPGMTPGFGIVRVAAALSPVFGGRQVDLVTRRGLAPRLRDGILASARVLHAAG
jgi:predicted nucleotidyltransferase/plasmid stability protein